MDRVNENQKIKIIYFSPTGNTEYLARYLQGILSIPDDDVINIGLPKVSLNSKLNSEEKSHLIIMFSIHGFNPPQKIIDFVGSLRRSSLSGVSFIAVGCNKTWVNDSVTSGLVRKLSQEAIPVFLDVVIAMPLTFIMNFPKEMNQNLINEARADIKKCAEMITKHESHRRVIPMKSRVLSFVAKAEKPAAKLFGLELHPSSKCSKCGKCIRECPSGNIREGKDGKPGFGLKCIMCMRCIYNCPEEAISPYISRFIPIKGGYYLEDYLEENRSTENNG